MSDTDALDAPRKPLFLNAYTMDAGNNVPYGPGRYPPGQHHRHTELEYRQELGFVRHVMQELKGHGRFTPGGKGRTRRGRLVRTSHPGASFRSLHQGSSVFDQDDRAACADAEKRA
jgi:hypothetical protein